MRNDERRGDEPRRRSGWQGPARRSYGEGSSNGPRVGAIYRDVPPAQRVDARGENETGNAAADRKSVARRGDAPTYRGASAGRRSPQGQGTRVSRRGAEGAGRSVRPGDVRPSASSAPTSEPRELAPALDSAVPPEENENLLAGRNPIREALKAGRSVEKLLVAKGDLSGAARDLIRMAKDAGAVVQVVERSRLDAIYPTHQGLLAYVAAVDYVSVDELFARASERGEDPFFVLLDGVTDPHNLGAILRSAECAGAHGAILPERRSAGLGPAAAKAAAGALDCLPVARVKNLNRTIDELKERGVWVIGTAMEGENALTADLTGPVALVIGSEGEGVSRLTLEKCDRTLTLPMRGRIESLNASVAAGILMYEVVRARSK